MCAKSKKIVELKSVNQTDYISASAVPGMSAAERLYKDAQDRLEKQFFQTTNDFKPQISHGSKYMTENSNMFAGNLKDFHSR